MLGVLRGDAVVLPARSNAGGRCSGMLELIDDGEDGLDALCRLVEGAGPEMEIPLGEVRLMAPVPQPRQNIICLGWNYMEHIEETSGNRQSVRGELPSDPVVFTKDVSTVNGPYEDIPHDAHLSNRLDWEVELAVVIGRQARKLEEKDALDYVFGYTVINDITARDLQKRHRQFFLGKSLPGSCPMGPCIVTRDEIPNPQNLRLESRVNGVVKQKSSTRSQIFGVANIIARLSNILTLRPGTVIATGTPSGVGYARKPPQYLRPGDVVECEVEGIGCIRNRIQAVQPAAHQ